MSEDPFAGDDAGHPHGAHSHAAHPQAKADPTAPDAGSTPRPAWSSPLPAESTPLPAGGTPPQSAGAARLAPSSRRQPEASSVDQPEVLLPDPYPPADDNDDLIGLGWPADNDPEQWPVADEEPDPDPLAPGQDFPGGDEAEYSAWLASLPADVREDYLAGPYTGAGEAIPTGFTHRVPGGPSGAGFASGGALDRLAPGPWLAQALADATAAGHDGLSESELIGVLLGCQRQVAWSQAQLASAVGALVARRAAQAARPGWSAVGEHVADELAIAMTLTGRAAGRLMDIATALGRLSMVAAALEAGRIDWPKACLFVDELAVLDVEQARQVAGRLLDRAAEQTTGQLRAALARAVLAADPAAAQRRKDQGRKDARVEVWREPSGNAALAGRELAPADAVAADAALTADAQWLRRRGAPGTLAELRAAAYLARLSGRDLAALLPAAGHGSACDQPAGPGQGRPAGCRPASPGRGTAADDGPADRFPAPADGADQGSTGGHDPGRGPGAGGPRPGGTIHLTMPLAALAGLTSAPGEIAGWGPADAATCRDLAGRLAASPAARWCLTLTGPGGRAAAHACARAGPAAGRPTLAWAAGLRGKLQILESGACRHPRRAPGYVWPSGLRHLIETRHRTCAAPGCRRPAARCDLDHTIPYHQGGPTCECNGAPLCRRHHRAKQAPGWHLNQGPPGHMTWQLPSGRTYVTTGESYAA